jgi:hypothetical protein
MLMCTSSYFDFPTPRSFAVHGGGPSAPLIVHSRGPSAPRWPFCATVRAAVPVLYCALSVRAFQRAHDCPALSAVCLAHVSYRGMLCEGSALRVQPTFMSQWQSKRRCRNSLHLSRPDSLCRRLTCFLRCGESPKTPLCLRVQPTFHVSVAKETQSNKGASGPSGCRQVSEAVLSRA